MRLLDTARSLFTERDFESVGVREIAAEAGVTPGMVAYYFGGKLGLFEAMFEHVFEVLVVEVKRLASEPAHEGSATARFIDLHIRTMARNPWLPRFIAREIASYQSPLRSRFVERFGERLHVLVPGLIERDVKEGWLRDDLDPELVLLSLLGMSVFPFLSHPVMGELLGYDLDPAFRDRWIEHTMRLFIAGARKEPQ